MAPHKPRPSEDDASSTTSEILKPKTEKAKVTKPKADKPKAAKKEKVESDRPKLVKKSDVTKKEGGDCSMGKGETGAVVGKVDKAAKEKVKAVIGDEACKLMVKYLREQNRPYSAGDVSSNLHGKVTKTVADKLLKEMEQNGKIMGKATKKDGGGQWVFWAIQDSADAATPEELAVMDTTISCLRESLPALKSELKLLTIKLNTLNSAPTTTELAATIQKLQEENRDKQKKLNGYKDGSRKIVTKEEVERAEKEWKYWGAKRKSRKIAFENLEALLLDGMSREEIWERVGIEGDVE